MQTQIIDTYINVPKNSDFSIHNLPFGVYSIDNQSIKKIGIAIGNEILDVQFCQNMDFFHDLDFDKHVFFAQNLNPLMALGRRKNQEIRQKIQHILSLDFTEKNLVLEHGLAKQSDVKMHLPIQIGDYTDFYSSIEHATNVGKLFRDPQNALLPNWRNLPVAYHGRASSIFVSGTNFHRPKGQILSEDNQTPIFTPTKALDFELEIATIIGKSSKIGESISTSEAEDYVFGFVLFNDWSARDIQRWEYQPLGPFLGKNFFSSISPWVVSIEALQPFRVASPEQNPAVFDYLKTEGLRNFDIELSVSIQNGNSEETEICRTNFKKMYWNVAQQIAHHTVNGCNLNTGDVLASGTISGSEIGTFGSLLELTANGKIELMLKDGSKRTFLEDKDTVIIRGFSEKNDIRIGFGEVKGTVLANL
ncbi:fumarylacetoacetase [Arcicella sp. LKC2W]|uniref:fumarylacetoacetase n=1 Tax=Arcicella sp. LKC2W TaxID=2984198 RepID=UPI002B210B32|nr:fumarylacetoacetase [Arcicella sp. LKC2W]MEA5457441.1 fumarylacetoacetase [Arcicella sp. LKC2W]